MSPPPLPAQFVFLPSFEVRQSCAADAVSNFGATVAGSMGKVLPALSSVLLPLLPAQFVVLLPS